MDRTDRHQVWPQGGTAAGPPTVDQASVTTDVQIAQEQAAAALLVIHSALDDNHHRQQHAAGGTDHTFPGGTTNFLRADGSFAAPGGGGNDSRLITAALTSDAPANSTTTLTTVMTQIAVSAGTYVFTYWVRWQSAALTTGINFAVDHTGTVTACVLHTAYASTGSVNSTGIGDQIGAAGATGMVEGKGARVKNTGVGATVGVDTVNADMLTIIEGLMVVTATGNLLLKAASEVAASAITVKAGTSLLLIRTA